MADLTFAELQRKMQIEKQTKQGVKYPFRTAEDINNKFKSLDSGWSVSFPEDDIIQKGDKLYYKAVAVAKRESDGTIEKAIGWAREEDVPIFHTQKGDVKQMQDPQWTGAVGSYARKYALQGLFAIGGEDVDEYPVEESQEQGQNNQQQQQQGNQQAQGQNQVRYIDNIQYQEIIKNVEEIATIKGAPFDTVANFVLSKYQIDDFHKVPVDGYNIVMNYLTKQIQKAYEKQGV
ncbi:ERF family protein [Streptococcus pneumoniae]|uniref:ERF domain protein n=4 Tax=root TaxID=1 RepID=A0A141DZL6_9CAUD|nr:ERF family protein [Streptococcus pneumoniae]YP_009322122.1 Erf-like ssDNA annealing protein [Streptococcus phage phiARI0468-4]YP_010664987.1 single-strand DNA binding protein [Streptococcus phage IPP52]ALA47223.1 ERF domain protein [Streptococcus phage phiARI0285-3]ALH47375.1 ERF domain protein [Streptococcus phage phiARI0378]ALA46925.1 ERF domain protein [Streptococcus phage phiARI0468-4]APD23746.1 single-strand DNA binding protein [Streptococcus phage IPP52]MBW5052236.1 ERF family prot